MNKLPKPKKSISSSYIQDGKLSILEVNTSNQLYERFNSTTPNVIVELFGQPQMGKTKTMIYTALQLVEKDSNSYVYIVTSIDRVSQRKAMEAKINSLSKYIGSDRILFGVSKYNGGDFESQILNKINNCPSCKIYVFYDEGHYGVQEDGTFSNTIYDLISYKNCRLLVVGATNSQLHLSNYQMDRVTMPVPKSYWGMSDVHKKIGTDYFLNRLEVSDLDILNHTKKLWNPSELNGYCMFWRTNEKNVDNLVHLIKTHTDYDWVIAASSGSKTIDPTLYNAGLRRVSNSTSQPNGIAEIVDNVWNHLQSSPKFMIVIIVDAFIAGDDFGDNKFRMIGWVESNTQLNAHTQSIGRLFCHLNWPLSWANGEDSYEEFDNMETNNIQKIAIRNETLVVGYQDQIEAQVVINNTPLSQITPELYEQLGIDKVGTGLKLSGSSDSKFVELSTKYEFDRFDKKSIIVSTLTEAGVSIDDSEEMWLRIQNFNNRGTVGKSFGATSLIQSTSYRGVYSEQNKVSYCGNTMYIFDFNRNNPNITIGGIINDSNIEVYIKNGHTTNIVLNPVKVSNFTIFAN